MGRKPEFNETDVLNALRDVFWQHGFEGTSYSDIMKATGLQKGSLYAAFGDKRSLYQKALAQYNAMDVDPAVKMLRNTGMTGKARIKALFKSTIDAAETTKGRWGCLLCNAAIDQAPHDPETELSVQNSMARLRSALKVALKDTQIPNGAEDILASYFGARVMIKAGLKKSALKAVSKSVMARL